MTATTHGYRYQVTFSKTFIGGVLEGMTIDGERIRFCDWHSADAFAQSCDGKTQVTECAGSGVYLKSQPVLEAI